MGLFEPQHLVIILIIALVIFGPGKIAELGGSLGRGVRDFKKAMAEPETPAPQPQQAAVVGASSTRLPGQPLQDTTVSLQETPSKEKA